MNPFGYWDLGSLKEQCLRCLEVEATNPTVSVGVALSTMTERVLSEVDSADLQLNTAREMLHNFPMLPRDPVENAIRRCERLYGLLKGIAIPFFLVAGARTRIGREAVTKRPTCWFDRLKNNPEQADVTRVADGFVGCHDCDKIHEQPPNFCQCACHEYWHVGRRSYSDRVVDDMLKRVVAIAGAPWVCAGLTAIRDERWKDRASFSEYWELDARIKQLQKWVV